MQEMLIALDVDGTLFDGVEVAPEAETALRDARADGHILVIVTGRRWEGLDQVVPTILGLCDRVVCEEGGVMVDVSSGKITLLAEPVEANLVAALEAAEVPMLDVGQVVIGAPAEFLAVVMQVRDRFGSTRSVVTNKGSIALAPMGCDKGTGLRAAVADLGCEGMPIIAIGDAANDLPMFAVATIPVGVANADDVVKASGVPLTQAAAGLGVVEALLLHLPRRPPA